jgi:hypothetical protein
MRSKIWMSTAIIFGVLVFTGWALPQAGGQAAGPTDQTAVTAAQRSQPDQLRQLEEQLQKDRAAVHEAIGKYGFNSDQVDAAREQLIRDRIQYRQMHRSMVAAGVAVPPASGMRAGRFMACPGRMGMRDRGMMRGGMMRGAMMRGGCRCQCPYGRN